MSRSKVCDRWFEKVIPGTFWFALIMAYPLDFHAWHIANKSYQLTNWKCWGAPLQYFSSKLWFVALFVDRVDTDWISIEPIPVYELSKSNIGAQIRSLWPVLPQYRTLDCCLDTLSICHINSGIQLIIQILATIHLLWKSSSFKAIWAYILLNSKSWQISFSFQPDDHVLRSEC